MREDLIYDAFEILAANNKTAEDAYHVRYLTREEQEALATLMEDWRG